MFCLKPLKHLSNYVKPYDFSHSSFHVDEEELLLVRKLGLHTVLLVESSGTEEKYRETLLYFTIILNDGPCWARFGKYGLHYSKCFDVAKATHSGLPFPAEESILLEDVTKLTVHKLNNRLVVQTKDKIRQTYRQYELALPSKMCLNFFKHKFINFQKVLSSHLAQMIGFVYTVQIVKSYDKSKHSRDHGIKFGSRLKYNESSMLNSAQCRRNLESEIARLSKLIPESELSLEKLPLDDYQLKKLHDKKSKLKRIEILTNALNRNVYES